jgi:mRNA interferase RelE/StbE
MKVEFLRQFDKDLDSIETKRVSDKLIQLIKTFENADSIIDIPHIRKLKGIDHCFRIRIGDYRIGVFIENQIVQFARIAHRKEIYRIFP